MFNLMNSLFVSDVLMFLVAGKKRLVIGWDKWVEYPYIKKCTFVMPLQMPLAAMLSLAPSSFMAKAPDL